MMNSLQNETMVFVLEAALDGITRSYLAENQHINDSALSESVQTLVRDEMLIELADKDRDFLAYKTTQKGLRYLLMTKSVHAMSTPIAEA